MYKLFLSLRYLRKRRIAFFAIAAVTLCTFMVLTVSSVMGGFLEMVRERSRGLLSDVILDNGSMQGFAYYQEFIDHARTVMPDEIVAATPIIYSYGILRFPDFNITKPIRVVGVRLAEYKSVNDFQNSLYYDRYYPGTTTFAEARMPVWGPVEGEVPALPPDLMEARGTWYETVTDPKVRERYRLGRTEEYRYPGPGRFYQSIPRVEEIIQRVAGEYKIEPALLEAPSEDPTVRAARRVAAYMSWDLRGLDLPALAETFGEADPDKMGELIRQVDDQRRKGGDLARLLRDLTLELIGPRYAGDPLPGVIIGLDMVAERNATGDYDRIYGRGEKVILSVLPLTRRGVQSGEGAKSFAMRYVDDSRTGVYDIDNLCVYGDFAYLQAQLGMESKEVAEGGGRTPPRTSQICIKLAAGMDPNVMRDRIQKLWEEFHAARSGDISASDNKLMGYVTAETWQERQRAFIAAVEKEKLLVTILFSVISFVAVIMVGCIFYMIVQEKTRDIGIVKSIGATSLGVASIFLSYGAAVGVVGSIVGAGLGVVFVRYINEMQDLLVRIHPTLQVWDPSVYTFDRIPNQVDPQEAIVIICVAIVASMVGSLVAARRAAKVWPVEALRYE